MSVGLVTTAFASAQAAPDPTAGKFTRAPILGLAGHRADLKALKNATGKDKAAALGLSGRSTKGLSPTATTAGIIDMGGAVCPTGQTTDAVYGHEGFENGLPFPAENDPGPFTQESGADAPDGTHWANSSLDAANLDDVHWLESNLDPVPQTGKVYMSFTYRGDFVDNSVFVEINDDGGSVAPDPEWGTVTLDITSQATTNNGNVDVFFDHVADPDTAGSFDVDDVTIYTCKAVVIPPPPPNSGIRGDWTGQGIVDLMATYADGTKWVYEGKGNGTVGSRKQVGVGWSDFTWQGSPGDLNLDGRPDLLARRSDGTLRLYSTLSNGGLKYVKQIGSGWNIMSSIVGMGDLNGDKRGDLVAVSTGGRMFSYLASATGLRGGTLVTSGWNIMTLLTSPGDMNSDGRGDLIARRSDGTLWFYAGRAGGGVIGGKAAGTGWNGISIL